MTPRYLGSEYDARFALVTRQAVLDMGLPTIATLLSKPHIAEMLATPKPESPDWMKKLESALLVGELDVEFMKVVNDHSDWLLNVTH